MRSKEKKSVEKFLTIFKCRQDLDWLLKYKVLFHILIAKYGIS